MSEHPGAHGRRREPARTAEGIRLYGLLAEFHEPEALIEAARRARGAGYRRLDAYTPFPIEEVADALGHHGNRLPLLVLIGGIVGAVTGYLMQYYASVIDYPLNVGGRPLHSIPSFIPVTFEMTILFASLTAVLGMLALNGLPMPYHPVFHVDRFAFVTRDRFFLCIEARDPKFDLAGTKRFLREVGSDDVFEVPE